MMDILEIKHIEDCFDGSSVREIIFDQPTNQSFIYYFGEIGTLQYYPSFSRPFFRIIKSEEFWIKGVEGNRSARITILAREKERILAEVMDYIGSYQGR